MTTSIEKIELLETELNGLLPMKPEYRQRLDKKIRLEFNYNSNHIEGNTLTYGETELLLIFGKTTGNHDIREYDEMKAHDAAFELIQEWAADNERPLTEMALKNLHKIILVEPFWKEALTPDGQPTRRLIKVGDYKEQPNSVRLQTGEIFHYASPAETPIKTGELIEWYRNEEEKKEFHPVVLAALLHYKFVLIHPFDDGNGRISRLLMNYILLKHNLPPVIIKSADKKNYLFALNQADTGDINAFINYIAEQLIWSLELYVKAAKGDDLEEKGDLQKEIAVLTKQFNSADKKVYHPLIAYETFLWVNKNVWASLRQSMLEFNSLFSEIQESHFFNYFPESFEKKNLFETPFLISTGPTKKKIFGYDIYEEIVQHVEWKLKLYGLKVAKSNSDIEINVKLTFEIDKYSISVSTASKIAAESEFKYGQYMMDSDIEKMQGSLSKFVLAEIKARI